MQNYTDLFNWYLGELFAKYPNEHNAIWEEIANEGEYRAGNRPFKFENKNLVIKAELATIYKKVQDAIYGNHKGMYYARIPYTTLDWYYKEAFKKAYLECKGFDYNKTAEYFYNSLVAHNSK